MNPVNLEIAKKTAEIAALLYVTPAQLAIAWILKKDPSMIPIIGATSTQQLDDNAGKLDFSIPDEFMQQLDQVSAIELGYPHDYLNSEQTRGVVSGNMWNRIQKARPSFRQAPG
jgi:diketogulonate reductase-like aldo/keto reductase